VRAVLETLGRGFRSVALNWGLVVLLLAVNLGLALLLAVPLAVQLERDLAHRGASVEMMYGFDHDWWSRWSEEQEGFARTFGPDVLGTGFAFRNVDLLLRGHLPAGLFARRTRADDAPSDDSVVAIDPAVLALGALYLIAQAFLAGGLLGVFRTPQGGWTFRGLVHGCGFYFARILRVSLLALLLAALVFALNAPLSRWLDERARAAVSETTALALGFGRHALLLLALILVHMLSSYAKVIVVREERQSAALALLSSLGFCARHFFAALGQYLAVIALGVLLLKAWAGVDARLTVSGWTSQLLALALLQLLVLGRIALRLGLLAGQLELNRTRGR